MRREHLAHLLRAASLVVDRRDLLVVGSESVLGTWDEEALPQAAILSLEADLAVFDDPGGELADRISGAIGELSSFDQSFGYHADGVGLETTHDCVVSKLVAGRPKDRAFAEALIDAEQDPRVLLDRIELLDDRVHANDRDRLRAWVRARPQR